MKGKDRAEERVATAAQADDFAPNAVLLGHERQHSEGSTGEVCEGHGHSGGTKRPDPELYIGEAEGTGVQGCTRVLAWA